MVGDASQLGEMAQRLISASGVSGADMELRSKVGRLNFSAGRYADRSGCKCQGCNLLRQANDLLAPESLQGDPSNAQSLGSSA